MRAWDRGESRRFVDSWGKAGRKSLHVRANRFCELAISRARRIGGYFALAKAPSPRRSPYRCLGLKREVLHLWRGWFR